MSFRTRLRLFFLLIVLLPIIAVTLIVFRLIAESEHGQADARIAARQDAALSLAYDARRQADRLAGALGRDPALAAALRSGDRAAIRSAALRLLKIDQATRILVSRSGDVLADVGSRGAVFPATRELVVRARRVAELQVAVMTADDFARLLHRVTHLDSVVRPGTGVVAATLDGSGRVALPGHPATVRIAGASYRTASFEIPGFQGQRMMVSLLEPSQRTDDQIRRGRLLASIVLAGFFLLALVAALLVTRSLQRQIDRFLVAARRLGAGDFSQPVPTRGSDEFAQLGEEFNKMSRELDVRMQELAHERLRLELSVRRIGEAFASNLDRRGLMDIMVRTAVDAVDAVGGRVRTGLGRGDDLESVTNVGEPETPALAAAVEEAERRIVTFGEATFADREGGHALAHPLRAGPAAGEAADRVTGVITVWRAEPFLARERELFNYLAGQAAASIENVSLHETVERQAVTDELTGLANRRRFQETMTAEVERAKRFGSQLGLVLLDIDNFKSVNDTYGHQQGDLVLREVAAVLMRSSREIDEPARYGGEELAVVLPGTDLVGAYNLAERVREGIEALELPILGDEDGEPMRVTASFGAASIPESAADVRSLVAAADGALYEAKRSGKNRTVRAA